MSDHEELLRGSIESALAFGVDIIGRRVFLHGDVGEGSIGVAIRGLYILSDMNSEKPIELYISSYGGDLDEAFALHDVTRTIRAPVHTVALGKCQSAAPILVACGQKRFTTENCSFMLHDAQVYGMGEDFAQNMQAMAGATVATMDRYASLLATYSKRDKRFWKRIFAGKTDRFFGADDALKWGLVDVIWSEKD
jgi:ATP-dependent Clp protease protease subunit